MCMCVYMNTERLVGRDGPSRRVEAVRIQPCHCLGMPWSLDCLAMKKMCMLRCFNQVRCKIRAGQVEAQLSVDRFTLNQ